MRFQDRLAHYMLHRAYFGLNARGATESEPAVDAHSIQFHFPEPICSAVIKLIKHASAEQDYALQTLDDFGEATLEEHSAGLVFTPPLEDFTRGLQLSDGGAALPKSMLTIKAKISLCAIVQHVCSELLDACQREHTVASLWMAIESNSIYAAMCRFLSFSWSLDATGLDSPLQLSCASKEGDALAHDTRFLESAFCDCSQAQSALNSSSWYFDEASLQSVARRAARGTLSEADISRQLRERRIQPLRFLGVASEVPNALRDFIYCEVSIPSEWVAFVTAELHDAANVVWPLLLCVSTESASSESIHSMLLTSDVRDSSINPSRQLCSPPCMVASTNAYLGEELTIYLERMRSPTGATFDGFGKSRLANETAQLEAHATQWRALVDAQKKTIEEAVGSSLAQQAWKVAQTAAQFMKDSAAKVATVQLAAEVEAAIKTAVKLRQFSLFGPTLYSFNQPLSVRRRFTSVVLDESMLAAGVTPLPAVLLDIVAQYAPVDSLPFVEDLAQAQMRSTGLEVFDTSLRMYEGQLDHEVEQPSSSSNAAVDVKWPVEIPPMEEGDELEVADWVDFSDDDEEDAEDGDAEDVGGAEDDENAEDELENDAQQAAEEAPE